MAGEPLDPSRRYLVKQTSRTVQGYVRGHVPGEALTLNGIAEVQLTTLLPLAVDLYTRNRHTGSFILIDPGTNATIAAGMIRGVLTGAAEPATLADGPVTADERAALWGHSGAVLEFQGDPAIANALERALLGEGCFVLRADRILADARQLAEAGALVLTNAPASGRPALTLRTPEGAAHTLPLSADPREAAGEALRLLRALRVLARAAEPLRKDPQL